MDLNDLVEPLKRTVAGPGEFDTYFPESDDTTLAGILTDAAAEAKLDGFLPTKVVDPSDLSVVPDPNSAEQALILIYADARILNARISNLKSRSRYKAGNVEAETEQAASVLQELLRERQARKTQLLKDLRDGTLPGFGSSGSNNSFAMVDLYITQSLGYSHGYGYGDRI